MAATIDLPAAGYRYIPFAFQYSGGVEALPGFRIERVEFARPLALAAGFSWIENYLSQQGVPLPGFCACELRSPAQFTDQGFIDFNRHYTGHADAMGRDEECRGQPGGAQQRHPAAAQAVGAEFPCVLLRASGDGDPGSFVIAGSGEAGDGPRPYAERTVRYGETSAGAMREKAVFVLGRMEERMAALREKLGRCHLHPSLYSLRCPLLSGGRNRPAGCRPARPALAPRAAAGRGAGIRDGLPVGAGGAPCNVLIWLLRGFLGREEPPRRPGRFAPVISRRLCGLIELHQRPFRSTGHSDDRSSDRPSERHKQPIKKHPRCGNQKIRRQRNHEGVFRRRDRRDDCGKAR